MTAVLLVLVLGVSTTFWSLVGLGRCASTRRAAAPADPAARSAGRLGDGRSHATTPGTHRPGRRPQTGAVTPTDVAVLVAAHNEELVIAETIRAASQLVDTGKHLTSSPTDPRTPRRTSRERPARMCWSSTPNRGKAGALAAGIEHFELCRRLRGGAAAGRGHPPRPDYLATGLPLFDDPEVVAVAGRARTIDDRGAAPPAGPVPGRLSRAAVPDRAVADEVRAGRQVGERGHHRAGLRQHVPHQRTAADRRHRRRPGHRGLQHDLRDPRQEAGPHRVPSRRPPSPTPRIRTPSATTSGRCAAGSSASGRPSGGTASTPASSGSRWPSSSSN